MEVIQTAPCLILHHSRDLTAYRLVQFELGDPGWWRAINRADGLYDWVVTRGDRVPENVRKEMLRVAQSYRSGVSCTTAIGVV